MKAHGWSLLQLRMEQIIMEFGLMKKLVLEVMRFRECRAQIHVDALIACLELADRT